jgi:hypothetical protein
MKTTTNRIHRNGATKPAPSQRKIRFGAEFKLPKDALHNACLCVFDRKRQELVQKIPLTEKEFADVWKLQYKNGRPDIGSFAKDLIAEVLRSKLCESETFSSLSELEVAKNLSLALMQLMVDSETTHLMEGDLPHSERSLVNAGVAQLVQQASEYLNRTFNEIFHAINHKHVEARPATVPA